MTSFFVFAVVCYSIAFLLADATIFGCGTAAYNEDPDDEDYIRSQGILKIRPVFLRIGFFQKLFTCYFCLGIWIGPVAHVLLYYAWGERYHLYHENTLTAWVLCLLVSSLESATSCYAVNAAIDKLSDNPPPIGTLFKELDRGDPEDDH